MKKLLSASVGLLLLGLSLSLAGCGADATGPKLVKANGTLVDKDGKPIAKANLQFAFDNGHMGMATSDDSGKFKIQHTGGGMGAPIGKAKVGVTKFPPAPPDPDAALSKEDRMKKQQAEMQEKMKSGGAAAAQPPAAKSELNEKYASPATSGLSVDIPAGGTDKLEIKLAE